MTQQQYSELTGELQRLGLSTGFFGKSEDRLFRKALRSSLSTEQRAQYEDLIRRRKQQIIESALDSMERRSKSEKWTLTARQIFVETLLKHGNIPAAPHAYSTLIIFMEAATCADQLEPLLSPEEWSMVQAQIESSRNSEVTLRKLGVWPIHPVEATDLAEVQPE